MAKPNSRQSLIDYCLRELGHPVIKINVAQEQVSDRIDDALQLFQEYNSDAVRKEYLRHEVTQTDIDKGYITIPNDVLVINQVLPFNGVGKGDKFSDNWQVQFDAISKLRYTRGGGGGLHSYEIAMNHLEMIDMMFSVGNTVSFSRYENKLSVAVDWEKEFSVGDFIVFEGSTVIDPDTTPLIWNDIMLKQYATALIKRQWGANLKKYDGVVMPGGITLDGQKIFDEAKEEIAEIKETMRDTYEAPVDFLVG